MTQRSAFTSPTLKRRGAFPIHKGILAAVCFAGKGPRWDLEFRVERWDTAGRAAGANDRGHGSPVIARAAFTEAVRQMPTMQLHLQHRGRVFDQHTPRAVRDPNFRRLATRPLVGRRAPPVTFHILRHTQDRTWP
jgi:hypothetical protein